MRSPDTPEFRWWVPFRENLAAARAVLSEIERNDHRVDQGPMKPWCGDRLSVESLASCGREWGRRETCGAL
jgi:hypothetical protein